MKIADDRFLNRELSWLSFNERVVQEAFNESNPLLERCKFLSISANNLREFYMVSVANLFNKLGDDGDEVGKNLLLEIQQKSQEIIDQQNICWEKIKQRLREQKIEIIAPHNYHQNDLSWLREYFISYILPYLKVSEGECCYGLNYVFLCKNVDGDEGARSKKTFINVGNMLERFIQLPAVRNEDGSNQLIRMVVLEDLVRCFKDLVVEKISLSERNSQQDDSSQGDYPHEGYPQENYSQANYSQVDFGAIYVTKAHIAAVEVVDGGENDDVFDDNIDLHEVHEAGDGAVVSVVVPRDIEDSLKNTIKESCGIEDCNFLYSDFCSFVEIVELYEKINDRGLKYSQYKIRFPERIKDFGGDCFAAINAKDIIIHHPYESFDVVVQFIKQAAKDPYVTEIKQTLYRVGANSRVVEALVEAAKYGKNVTVIVELKARFDEVANSAWGQELKEAGAKVIYNVLDLKVHAKMLLIKRVNHESNLVQSYVHYGTGNYHHINAKIYADLSFFTCDKDLCDDAQKIFDFMESGIAPEHLKKVSLAPFNLRNDLISLINREIIFAENGQVSNIWLKMNSLADNELIEMLYKASQAGVKIELIIRGICCLRPGIRGLSENITVKSIVGRFLEHSRIYCFGNGHQLPSQYSKIFIAPADWIKRKLNKRIELMIPIENKTVHEQVLHQIMLANIKDEKQSWKMLGSGEFVRVKFDKNSFSAHDFFMENPSLSGQGSALQNAVRKVNFQQHNEIAVFDIGSNSVRLVIYDGLKRHPLALFNEKVTCGLAKDLEKTGCLNKDGAILARNAIERFSQIVQEMNIEQIFCFATSAVRDANDGKEFIKEIESECPIKIQLLSGEEEAYLAAMGIASSFYSASGLVGDLGGGSLELAEINVNVQNDTGSSGDKSGRIVANCVSFPIGSLRLESIAQEKKVNVGDVVNDFFVGYPIRELLQGRIFYAVGGGFRAIAKIHISRCKHPLQILDEFNVCYGDLVNTLEVIIRATPARICEFPISTTRKKTLVNSAILLKRIIEIGQPSGVSFSTHGVRDGILFDKLSAHIQIQDGLIAGCGDMIDYISPTIYNNKNTWLDLGQEIFRWIQPVVYLLKMEQKNRLIRSASILARMAWHEHSPYRGDMAFSWVLDAKIPAIKHEERVFIATILYHRYRTSGNTEIMRKPQKLLTYQEIQIAKSIGMAIRLAYQLCGGAKSILSKVELQVDGQKLRLLCAEEDNILINRTVNKRLDKLNKFIL